MTGVAFVVAWDTDFGFLASRCFFQRDFHGVTQVASTIDLSACSPPVLTKHIAKNITKSLSKATPKTVAWPTSHIGIDARMAMLVISRSFLGVTQHFVGLFGLFKLLLS